MRRWAYLFPALLLVLAIGYSSPAVCSDSQGNVVARVLIPEPNAEYNTTDYSLIIEFNAAWVRAHTDESDPYNKQYVWLTWVNYEDMENDGHPDGINDEHQNIRITADENQSYVYYTATYKHYDHATNGDPLEGLHRLFVSISYGATGNTTTACTLNYDFYVHSPDANVSVTFREPQSDDYYHAPGETTSTVPIDLDYTIESAGGGQVCVTLEKEVSSGWDILQVLDTVSASTVGTRTVTTNKELQDGSYRVIVYLSSDSSCASHVATFGARYFRVSEVQVPPPSCGLVVVDYPKDGESYPLNAVPFRVTVLNGDLGTWYEYRFSFYKRSGITWSYKGDQIVESEGTTSRTLGYPINEQGHYKMEVKKCIKGTSECSDVCNSVEFDVTDVLTLNYNWIAPCEGCTYEYNKGDVPVIPLKISGDRNFTTGALCFRVGSYGTSGWSYQIEPYKIPAGEGSFSIDENLTTVTTQGSYRIQFYKSDDADCSTVASVIEERSFKVVEYVPPEVNQPELNGFSPDLPWKTKADIVLPPPTADKPKREFSKDVILSDEFMWYSLGLTPTIPAAAYSPILGFAVFGTWNLVGLQRGIIHNVEAVAIPLLIVIIYIVAGLIRIGGGGR